MTTATVSIGGENNYIVATTDELTGVLNDMTVSNSSVTGDINMKLGAITDTSVFSVENSTTPIFSVSGGKKTKFRASEILSLNTGVAAGEKCDIRFGPKNDADTSVSTCRLNYNIDTPVLSNNLNFMKSWNIDTISANSNQQYTISSLMKGIIRRTNNTSVTDTLPNSDDLVGGIHRTFSGNVFYFMISNANDKVIENIIRTVKIDGGADSTWTTNSSDDVKYLVPGQNSLYKLTTYNVNPGAESYLMWRMCTQGERTGDNALRAFSDNSSPIAHTLTSGVVYDLPNIITNSSFEKYYPAYTFFNIGGTSSKIINHGPPLNVRIALTVFLKTDSAAAVFIKNNITINGTAVFANGSQGAMYKTLEVSGGVSMEYTKTALDIDDTISASITSATTCDIEIISCQLSVYQF